MTRLKKAIQIAEIALREYGPEIAAEQWYEHRIAAEIVVSSLYTAGYLFYDKLPLFHDHIAEASESCPYCGDHDD